jgi:hypothetical protein
MKKKLSLTALIMLLLTVFSYAQDDRKGYVSWTPGLSIPVGDFGNKDLDNDNAGLAKLGFSSALTFAHTIGDHPWGYAFSISIASYALDVEGLEKELEFVTGGNWSVKSDKWNPVGFYAGAFRATPLGDKLFFDAKLLVGAVMVDFPTLNASTTGGSVKVVGKEFALGLGYIIGGAFRYNVSEKFALMFHVDYNGTSSMKWDTQTLSQPAGSIGSTSDEAENKISAVNIGIGIAYRVR